MFDGKKLGAYIQFLRKSRGLTQSKLAESLGVSPQAVSNWERGESMPDISILSEVARALGTSADRMLTAAEDFSAEAYEKLARMNEPEEAPAYVPMNGAGNAVQHEPPEPPNAPPEPPPPSAAKKTEIISIVKDTLRKALDGIAGETGAEPGLRIRIEEKIDEAVEAARGESERRESMEQARCFTMDAEEELLRLRDRPGRARTVTVHVGHGEHRHSGPEDEQWRKVISLAPFASQETMDALVADLDIELDLPKIVSVAPFVSASTLGGLAEKAFEAHGGTVSWGIITSLAPFIGSDELEKLLLERAGPGTLGGIAGVAPFISSQTLKTLISRMLEGGDGRPVDWRVITSVAPFLDSADLEQILTEHPESASTARLAEIAPFLGRGAIDRIIMRSMEKK